jgi:hypothetical protein
MLVPDGARDATSENVPDRLFIDRIGQEGAHGAARQDRIVDNGRLV